MTIQIGAVLPLDLFGEEQTRSPGLIQAVAVAMISLARRRSRKKPVEDEGDKSCRRHGKEYGEKPSELWIMPLSAIELSECYELTYLRRGSHNADLIEAFFQLGFQAQTRKETESREQTHEEEQCGPHQVTRVHVLEQREYPGADQRVGVHKRDALVFHVADILPVLIEEGGKNYRVARIWSLVSHDVICTSARFSPCSLSQNLCGLTR